MTITDLLGHRSATTLFAGRSTALGLDVVVKLGDAPLADEQQRVRLLEGTVALTRSGRHPHVVDLHDAGVTGQGHPYLVTAPGPGGSLAELLIAEGPLPSGVVLDLAAQLADGLAAVHAVGQAHGAIGPATALLAGQARIALLDLGLSTALGQRPDGDPAIAFYASPQALLGAGPDPADDVYALAATVHTLLLGRPPHLDAADVRREDGSLDDAALAAHRGAPLEQVPGVRRPVSALLCAALHPDRHQRPDARSLHTELRACAEIDDLAERKRWARRYR